MNTIHNKINQLDLNLLKIFEAVYSERNLSRAAQNLALTPSAVSHAIRRLREQLEDELFLRDGRSMQPTATCQRMAPALLEHMAQLRQLLQQWGQFNPAQTRQTFRIGLPDALEPLLLPAIARSLAQQAPQATLASSSVDRKSMVSALATGNLHLVIDVALPVSEPLKHEPLLDDAFCIVARAGHPIGKRVTLAKYLKSDHIAVSTRSRGTVIEDNALLNLGLERRIAARCQNYYSACRLVEQSDYLLTMPARLAQQVDATNTLTRFQPPFVVPAIQLHMYWHANNDADLPNAWLRSLISEIEADQGFV